MKKYTLISLNDILGGGYNQAQIEEAFKKFSCQREPDLENFLVSKAISYENINYGKTYLCLDETALQNQEFTIMAYFTLAQKSVSIENISQKKRRKMLGEYPGRDHIDSIPAYLIGQLGRDDSYSHDDLPGEVLLNECYSIISVAARAIGGNLLILECREHMYDKFYSRHEFKKLYEELNDENLYTLYKKLDFSEYWSQT